MNTFHIALFLSISRSQKSANGVHPAIIASPLPEFFVLSQCFANHANRISVAFFYVHYLFQIIVLILTYLIAVIMISRHVRNLLSSYSKT